LPKEIRATGLGIGLKKYEFGVGGTLFEEYVGYGEARIIGKAQPKFIAQRDVTLVKIKEVKEVPFKWIKKKEVILEAYKYPPTRPRLITKPITEQFVTPRLGITPVLRPVTKFKRGVGLVVSPAQLAKVAQVSRLRLKQERALLLKTKPLIGQKVFRLPKTALRIGTFPISVQAVKQVQRQRLKTRQVLGLKTRAIVGVGVGIRVPKVPTTVKTPGIVPFALPSRKLKLEKGVLDIKKPKFKPVYTPSVEAGIFKIKGLRPRRITGLEIRPLKK